MKANVFLMAVAIISVNEIDFATAFLSHVPSGHQTSVTLSQRMRLNSAAVAKIGTEDATKAEIMKRRKGEDATLAPNAKKAATYERASPRLKLKEEAVANWDAEMAAKNDDVANPMSVRQILIKKKKGTSDSSTANVAKIAPFSSTTGGNAIATVLPTKTSKTKEDGAATVAAVAVVPVDDEIDIFDTIMIASLETEKAGLADQVSRSF